MELIVTLGDRQERVRIRPIPQGYEVGLGEVTYVIDAEEAGALHSFLVRQTANGDPRHHQREVFMQASREGEYWVRSGGPNPGATVRVADPLTHLAQETRAAAGGGGRTQVSAYMPGRVVAVLVQEGEAVKEGQGVIVLEAMKMENEIPAEGSGRVARMLVDTGQAVDAGDPLFETEPIPEG